MFNCPLKVCDLIDTVADPEGGCGGTPLKLVLAHFLPILASMPPLTDYPGSAPVIDVKKNHNTVTEILMTKESMWFSHCCSKISGPTVASFWCYDHRMCKSTSIIWIIQSLHTVLWDIVIQTSADSI